jgi:CP family cyanate transporter-like MFS transporter
MTLVGYGIAFVLPLMGGWLANRLDSLEFALIPSLIFMAAVLLVAGRERRCPQYE